MAWTIADGLGWLPAQGLIPPHRRTRLAGGMVAPFAAVTIAVPAVAGALAFLPHFPDSVPHRRSLIRQLNPQVFEAALRPTSWLPTYPGMVPHRRLSVAAHPSLCVPSPSELILVAQRMAWIARFPATVAHSRPPNPGGEIYMTPPQIIAAGEACVELTDQTLTSPTLRLEALTSPDLLGELLTQPVLITEDLC